MAKFTIKCAYNTLKKVMYTETHGKLAVLREEQNETDK